MAVDFQEIMDAGAKLGFTRGLLTAMSLFSQFSDEYRRIASLAHHAQVDELALLDFTARNERARTLASAKEAV